MSIRAEIVVSECYAKKRYRTLGFAEELVAQALQKRGHVVTPYRCEWCDGFHLTSHPRPAPTKRGSALGPPPEPDPSDVKALVVAGGRNYCRGDVILHELQRYRPGTILGHGNAAGSDRLCARLGKQLGLDVRPFPVMPEEWERFGRGGGPVRNGRMLRAIAWDILAAFPGESGTADCTRQARGLRIPVRLVGGT